jgi:site-specific DNA recombinase
MEQVRELLRHGAADVILAFAVDRLSRNQNHIGVLFDEANQSGVKLDFVTEKFEDTAVGRFILAARAFVAEVEREKIVERTQRGKAQRARNGKLPEATGRGIYGYRYDASTGTRTVDARQAAIVREVFESFAAGGSCNGIASSLNLRGVPAFGGGQWYPLTIRRMLLNETYTGRSAYRRLKTEKYRDNRSGKWKVRVVQRDEAEWIEVEDATPAVVSADLFLRAKAIRCPRSPQSCQALTCLPANRQASMRRMRLAHGRAGPHEGSVRILSLPQSLRRPRGFALPLQVHPHRHHRGGRSQLYAGSPCRPGPNPR